jgi:hypothetical protein
VLQRAEMTILFHYQALVATLKELTVSPVSGDLKVV